jgi:single-strand DNA-binding protein
MIKGRLCADPEIRYSQASNGDNVCIARYRVAVNRKTKRDEADFISCVAFGKNGEFAEKYLKKGQEILIVGHIQTGDYTNKDGQKVYTTDVVVEEHEFCGTKADAPQEKPQKNDGGYMVIPENITDDLPFK